MKIHLLLAALLMSTSAMADPTVPVHALKIDNDKKDCAKYGTIKDIRVRALIAIGEGVSPCVYNVTVIANDDTLPAYMIVFSRPKNMVTIPNVSQPLSFPTAPQK